MLGDDGVETQVAERKRPLLPRSRHDCARPGYDEDVATFGADGYAVAAFPGVAFWVWGWETEPDEDTEWTGQEVRTGRVLTSMVGDDRRFAFDPEDLTPLGRDAYCGGCGQIGCER